MTTPATPEALREELAALDDQITEMQRTVDESRQDLEETSDKTAAIEGAERQEQLIEQLALRRRELQERLDNA